MEQTTSSSKRIIEEISLNAWPCLRQILYDGWILRFANGYTRRANSVNPIYPGSLNVAEKIMGCEQIYQDRQQTPIFKITPFVHPPNLDAFLAEAGYHKNAPTSVQWLDLATLSPQDRTGVEQWETPTEVWIDEYTRMNQVLAANRATLEAILNSINPKSCFMILQDEGQTVACGLGVLEGQYVGLFDIVTEPAHRGKGFGTRLILNILNWAKQHGATRAYLQVMLSNAPALNLYAKLGFEEIYQYWYRVLPADVG